MFLMPSTGTPTTTVDLFEVVYIAFYPFNTLPNPLVTCTLKKGFWLVLCSFKVKSNYEKPLSGEKNVANFDFRPHENNTKS